MTQFLFKTIARLLTQHSSLARCLTEPGVFRGDLDASAKVQLFTSLVNYVEFEPHAYCNRSCVFCPNSTLDRKTNRQVFDRALHRKVLKELAGIDYSGTVAYSRYSEPLAREEIFDYIAEARGLLPHAYLKIITNGDYLDHERLQRLQSSGLNYLAVSIYLPEGVAWSPQAALGQIEKFSKRIGMDFQMRRKTRTRVFVDYMKNPSAMRMDARCHDFGPGKQGFDRGMSVAWLSPSSFVRKDPCLFVFRNFTMDFNGNVMPCCNLRSDYSQHAPYVLGNVARETVFDIFSGPSSVQWRRGLSGFAFKSAPCKHCQDASMTGVLDRFLTAAWNFFSA